MLTQLLKGVDRTAANEDASQQNGTESPGSKTRTHMFLHQQQEFTFRHFSTPASAHKPTTSQGGQRVRMCVCVCVGQKFPKLHAAESAINANV